jgi:diguanylate cyclase (GGDEF)-like protein
MEEDVKQEQGSKEVSARKGIAGWLKDSQGGLSAGRSFTLLLLLAFAGAFIASAAGSGIWLTAVLMAILTAVLVHALIITPLARDYEAHLKAKPQASTILSSTMDALTRVPNQRAITSSLLDAMSYANRYNHPLSVALVDLDMLTSINREMGRKAGDKALQTVAAVFTDTLRMPDHAGRYDDEEFLVILPNTTLKNATTIAERIRDGVESADCSFNDKKIPVTVSIGASQFHKGEDLERFLARVDKALAAAKVHGRNRVVAERRTAIKAGAKSRGASERRVATARSAP